MIYGSVCSGIEAASVAWHPLGWRPAWFAEIEKFPSAVLAHRWPGVKNHGDFTRIEDRTRIDLLVGGTPCQSFSIAGLRGGLDDHRGNLALEFMRLADRLRPRWIVWENVPGVLSSNGGRDFGSILGALVELGYGFAYRVLDAQFFGVPQRRRRVFLVGHLGDWRRAAAVLFESESLRRDSATGRKAGEGVTGAAAVSVGGNVSHTLRGVGFDASEDGTGRGTPVVAFAENSRAEVRLTGDVVSSLGGGGKPGQGYPAIAFQSSQSGVRLRDTHATLDANNGSRRHNGVLAFHHTQDGIAHSSAKGGDPSTDNYVTQDYRVRRLTPRECERLQGFPDDYTLVPGASDSARYKALGNSMAVPVMNRIGTAIALLETL